MLPAFRGAIVEKVGKQHDLFHNHCRMSNSSYGVLYRYPLIQYKCLHGKAAIICLEQGTKDIHHLLGQGYWDITMMQQPYTLEIDNLKMSPFELKKEDRWMHYRLYHWIALNAENYEKYQALDSMIERIQLLERVLTAHILSFAAGVGWNIEEKFEVKIVDVAGYDWVTWKDVELMAFKLEFKTNLALPYNIGLGKAVSHGYGLLHPMRKKIRQNIKNDESGNNSKETDIIEQILEK